MNLHDKATVGMQQLRRIEDRGVLVQILTENKADRKNLAVRHHHSTQSKEFKTKYVQTNTFESRNQEGAILDPLKLLKRCIP